MQHIVAHALGNAEWFAEPDDTSGHLLAGNSYEIPITNFVDGKVILGDECRFRETNPTLKRIGSQVYWCYGPKLFIPSQGNDLDRVFAIHWAHVVIKNNRLLEALPKHIRAKRITVTGSHHPIRLDEWFAENIVYYSSGDDDKLGRIMSNKPCAVQVENHHPPRITGPIDVTLRVDMKSEYIHLKKMVGFRRLVIDGVSRYCRCIMVGKSPHFKTDRQEIQIRADKRCHIGYEHPVEIIRV